MDPFLEQLDQDQQRLYLEHIGVEKSKDANLEFLTKLQQAHLLTIPFEDLAIHIPRDYKGDDIPFRQGPGVKTSINDTFDKIVLKKEGRGGYCFEVNQLFAALLRSLEFKVVSVAGRVYAHMGSDPKEKGYAWGSASHQVSLVHLETEVYMVDVGFGMGNIAQPLPLKDGTYPGFMEGEKHRLTKCLLPGVTEYVAPQGWMLEHNMGYWSPMYHFVEMAIDAVEIASKSYAVMCMRGSLFTEYVVATKAILVEGGIGRATIMVGIKDDKVDGKCTKRDTKNRVFVEETIANFNELKTALRQHLDIVI